MLKNGSEFASEGRRYTVLEMLGSGANAVAYLAECESGGLTTKCILKEFSPRSNDYFDAGKARFIASGRAQNEIRQRSALTNQIPPVSRIFEANGTAYIDVVCFGGTTLDKLDLTLPQYMAICETIAKTVGYYHKAGYLCLDLKPENIFILQNAPDDTITQIVEFIDFDSVREITSASTLFSYTREWAAPEQLNPYATAKIGTAADIYTVGEIVFYMLFGRHSTDTEHRGFSKYPFAECRREYRKYTDRPDVQRLFPRIFRGTIRSSAANRFGSVNEVARLLGKLTEALNQKDYVIPKLPAVSPDFVGRETELKDIAESLSHNPVLYVTGVGGIGKSTLIKNYISRHKTDYDVITYLEYDGDFKHTLCDDMQLQISTVSRQEGEPLTDYFARKLTAFKRICGEKRVLFVLDNFTGKLTKDISRMIDCGYDTIIATRNQPPKNSFPFMEVMAITDMTELFRLITLNLERSMTREERTCFEEIIELVQGHTLVIELIARQIAAGRLGIHTAFGLIHEHGFSRFSCEQIGNVKDGEEVYDTLSTIVTALFDAGNMSDAARLTLKVLSLLNLRGLEQSLLQKFFPEIESETIEELCAEGWLYADERVRLHPVIAETVCHWDWSAEDVMVMDRHKKMIDIYVGMANDVQIKNILREADIYRARHERHIVNGIYFDMLGCYYDTLIGGAYYPENDREAELLEKLFDAMDSSIDEMSQSSDCRSTNYLTKYCLDMANVMIRSTPEYYAEAAELLDTVRELIDEFEPEYCKNRGYYCMVSAWYYTLAEPDNERVKELIGQAERIARQVFSTDLELIDIIHIPAANCFYYHGELQMSTDKIEEAVSICKKYPDILPYIDKRAELLRCLLDIYLAINNMQKCRELIAEIDSINEKYREQGIFREIPNKKREQVI